MKKICLMVFLIIMFSFCYFADNKDLTKFDIIYQIQHSNNGKVITTIGNINKIMAIDIKDAINICKEKLTKKYIKLLKYKAIMIIKYTKKGKKVIFNKD